MIDWLIKSQYALARDEPRVPRAVGLWIGVDSDVTARARTGRASRARTASWTGRALRDSQRAKAPGPSFRQLGPSIGHPKSCLLYTSDAADDLLCVDLGGRRII